MSSFITKGTGHIWTAGAGVLVFGYAAKFGTWEVVSRGLLPKKKKKFVSLIRITKHVVLGAKPRDRELSGRAEESTRRLRY